MTNQSAEQGNQQAATVSVQQEFTPRRHDRYDFSYPLAFKLFSQDFGDLWIEGNLKDISMGGACIRIEDPYGRLSSKQIRDLRMKLKLSEPSGEKLLLLAVVRWCRSGKTEKGMVTLLGVEFDGLLEWQEERLQHLIKLKGKDHKMLWSLWDNFMQAESR